MIKFIKYVLLGLVQGITEPLPISSSGHLVIFKKIFNVVMENELSFNIFVNFGSLIAILIYYRLFLKDIICGAFSYLFKKNKEKKNNFMYCVYVVIASIPAGIVGIILKDKINSIFSELLPVAICLFVTGLLLIYIHYQSKHATREEVTLNDSILMGCAQCVGLLPGISRSGSTSSMGVLNKLKLESALRFSFMMYIPASIGSLLLDILDFNSSEAYIPGYIGACIMSFIGTFISITLFFKIVKKENLRYFGYYCITIALLVLGYLVIK